MQAAICWCNTCHARRFNDDDRRKFNDCKEQEAIDLGFKMMGKAELVAQDAVVEANRKLLLDRSNVGLSKYGVTLAGSGLGRRALLQHALEEALDLANYLQAEIMRLDKEGMKDG